MTAMEKRERKREVGRGDGDEKRRKKEKNERREETKKSSPALAR